MIFVTVGMHHQGFERLIRPVDDLAGSSKEPVTVQIGSSSYVPTHATWFRFADQSVVDRWFASARVVVGHAGAGTVLTAARHRKPLVLVPRRAARGEHVNEHQLELVQALSAEGRVVMVAEPSVASLRDAIDAASDLEPIRPAGERLARSVAAILAEAPSRGSRVRR